jgi:hypothetical protein
MGTFAFPGQGHEHGVQDDQRESRNSHHDSLVSGTVQFVAWFRQTGSTSDRETARRSSRTALRSIKANCSGLRVSGTRWTSPQGELIESCTILTTTPNPLLSDIHARMPVILSPVNYDLLDGSSFQRHHFCVGDAEALRPGADEALSGEHESQLGAE